MKSLIEQFTGSNFLITTSEWFFAPDGKQYKAVWGKVKIYNDSKILGIKTNIRSTNWYAVVGGADTFVVVAGCQIHYACASKNAPKTDNITQLVFEKFESKEMEIESRIYLAQ